MTSIGPLGIDPVLAAPLAVLVTVLAVALVALAVRSRRRRGRAGVEPFDAEPEDRPLPAVVVNPTKFGDVELVRAQIGRVCTELGWAEPLWLETTEADPGAGQAGSALDAGADVVLACGGDGTIRHVAKALAGSGVAMGLLPTGTGNLLARNLDIPLDDLTSATRVALSGDDRPIDVGRLAVDGAPDEQVFMVMAGMGFDAAIMAGASEGLKSKIGALAYGVSGLRALRGRRARITLGIDHGPELQRRVRAVEVGNCGRLLAGLVLMPEAHLDDGLLDVVAISPKGLTGWLAVTVHVITRRRRGHRRVEHWQGAKVSITAESAQQVQLDGDPIGTARRLGMRVEHQALLVRVPVRGGG